MGKGHCDAVERVLNTARNDKELRHELAQLCETFFDEYDLGCSYADGEEVAEAMREDEEEIQKLKEENNGLKEDIKLLTEAGEKTSELLWSSTGKQKELKEEIQKLKEEVEMEEERREYAAIERDEALDKIDELEEEIKKLKEENVGLNKIVKASYKPASENWELKRQIESLKIEIDDV